MVKCQLCSKSAIFALAETPKIKYCKSHASEEMIDVVNKRCHCGGRAHYGLPEDKTGSVCGKHASKEMINLSVKPCNFQGCKKQPCFGIDKPIRCLEHIEEGMFDVKNSKCSHAKCKTRPCFGLPEDNKATFCKKHKEENMIDLAHTMCALCNVRACYGVTKATHCAKHKEEGMANVVSNKCDYEGCELIPHFGVKGKTPTHCSKHKEEKMIDLKHSKCEYMGCDTQAVFGLDSGKVSHCSKHKSKDMIDIKSKKCEDEICEKIATFGIKGGSPTHCFNHKCNKMVDVKHKTSLCTHCGLFRYKNYKPYCASCYYHLNPEDERSRNYKTKENTIIGLLKQVYTELVQDKAVEGGCSKRRPDGLIDLLTHSIVIEIDEDQHSSYDQICENKRAMQLFTDLGSRPIIFIRLNPDSYQLDGKKIDGCFEPSYNGLSLNERELAKRMDMLHESIANSYQVPEKEITIIKLCFSD